MKILVIPWVCDKMHSPAKFACGVEGLLAVCENKVLTRFRVTVLWARSKYLCRRRRSSHWVAAPAVGQKVNKGAIAVE